MDDRRAILARLDRLGELVFGREPAVVDELWSDLGFILYGSEAGESAHTREELAHLFEGLYALPFRIRWRWDDPAVTISRDIAWFISEGQIELTYPDRMVSQPYRLAAIFQKVGGQWKWRLYSGSEPATPPAGYPAITSAAR